MLREAIWQLNPGEMSDPVLLGEQYAIVLLEREILPDDVQFEDVEEKMAHLARLRLERIEMDALARVLIATPTVNVFGN